MDIEIADLLKRGLNFGEACMLLEAISSCAIEGINIDEKSLDRLCKKVLSDRENREEV